MLTLNIIHKITAEKRQTKRVPCHAAHLEVMERYRQAAGTSDGMAAELEELIKWDMITATRTAHGTAYLVNE